jgi:hypothetical protein
MPAAKKRTLAMLGVADPLGTLVEVAEKLDGLFDAAEMDSGGIGGYLRRWLAEPQQIAQLASAIALTGEQTHLLLSESPAAVVVDTGQAREMLRERDLARQDLVTAWAYERSTTRVSQTEINRRGLAAAQAKALAELEAADARVRTDRERAGFTHLPMPFQHTGGTQAQAGQVPAPAQEAQEPQQVARAHGQLDTFEAEALAAAQATSRMNLRPDGQ